MADIINAFVSNEFLREALIVGLLVSLSASLLGVSLVLKRFSMIGDGLSHVGFGAVSAAAAFAFAPLAVAIPVVIITAFFLLKLNKNSRINGDAAIALISSSALAFGVFINSVSTNIKADLNSYMFGSIFAIAKGDLVSSIILSFIVLFLFIFFYNKIFAVTFDEDFASATGTKSSVYNMLIAFLTSVTIVIGMRMMGALLISSLLIFPALTSMRVFRSFRSVVISSATVSSICFITGLILSYIFNIPVGPSVVLINLMAFIIFYIIGKILKK